VRNDGRGFTHRLAVCRERQAVYSDCGGREAF